MEELPGVLAELRDLAARGLLSEKQVEITLKRFEGGKYDDIIREFSLSGATALVHCFVRTACARPWVPGDSGGSDSY